jgi:uncharacterized protein
MTSLSERLVFDADLGEIRDQTRRYLMLRPEVLMGALRRLEVPARRIALEAFAASVAAHGKDSVLAYREHAGADDGRLLQAMEGAAAALGWGHWRFEPGATALALTVENSPFAAGFGACEQPVCAPIAGMLQAVAEVVLGREVDSVEHTCVAAGAAACTFEARHQSSGRSE